MRASVFCLLLTVLSLAGCSGTIHAVAPTPAPKVAGAREPGATFGIAVLAVPDSTCAKHADLKDLCVDGLSDAMRAGLTDVLGRSFAPAAGESPTYTAELRFQELTEEPEVAVVRVSMRWQFVLRDRVGNTLVELAENTLGKERLTGDDDAERVLRALLGAVFDRIGGAIASRKAATACVSGITQTCAGPNGCQGAQFCVDGKRFSPCDCTSKP